MHVRVDTERDGYLYLLYCDAKEHDSLFPNHLDQDKPDQGRHCRRDSRSRGAIPIENRPALRPRGVTAIVSLARRWSRNRFKSLWWLGPARREGRAASKAVYVEMKNQPATWAEHYVATRTLPRGGERG